MKRPLGVHGLYTFHPSSQPHPQTIIRLLTGAAVWTIGIIVPWVVLFLVSWGALHVVVEAAAALLGG